VPRLVLDKKGIIPETYFGKVVYTGSHENAVLALVQGTVDVAANAWTDEKDSTLTRMISKGMLKNTDGSLMKYEDFRIIEKSDPILNGPIAYLSDLPPDLKAKIAEAFFNLRKNDKAAADKIYDGKLDREGWAPAKTEDWNPVVDLVKFVDTLRRKN
jgi:phosphonate transport system substrate-binding protein